MSNPDLELINPFPVHTRQPTPMEVVLAQARLEPLPGTMRFGNEKALVDAIIADQGNGPAHSAFEDALKTSPTYKKWQSSMPFLKDVPDIRRFRSSKHPDLAAVNNEVLKNGGYLPSGQILYRGGHFNAETIVTNEGPTSTSMHPGVGWWHAIEVGGQVAILRIVKNRNVRGFVFRTSGHQKLKHEYEVLVQGRLRLEQTSKHSVGAMGVRTYDVLALP